MKTFRITYHLEHASYKSAPIISHNDGLTPYDAKIDFLSSNLFALTKLRKVVIDSIELDK